jgi:soluble lytic murein transglycosylase-like protein
VEAGQVAFRFLPVGLAFLLSFLSILWLTAFRPVSGAAVADVQNHEVNETNHELVQVHDDNMPISSIFTAEVHHWAEKIKEWSLQFSLDPNLVAVVMQIESCGHPEIQSSAGALGLFQVMPFHFSEDERGLDPGTNAKRGLSYLSRALEISEGDQALALAGYNGGHSVINWDQGYWPAETSRYVYWGTGILEDIRAGLTDSPRLQEWLSNGGASLCSLAAEAIDL